MKNRLVSQNYSWLFCAVDALIAISNDGEFRNSEFTILINEHTFAGVKS